MKKLDGCVVLNEHKNSIRLEAVCYM